MTAISGTTYERIRYACQNWVTVFNDNMQRLEDTGLYLENLFDVDITGGLNDGDVLQWNGSKFVPVAPTFMMTT